MEALQAEDASTGKGLIPEDGKLTTEEFVSNKPWH